MDMSKILSAVSRMFPNTNVSGAVQKAQQMMQGTPDTLAGVSSAAHRIGIDQTAINTIFQKYGSTVQARALCSMLGTTPEALKSDAEKIVSGGSAGSVQQAPKQVRFPRLK